MNSKLNVTNPKRRQRESIQSAWYKYYPGFAESFARSILSSAGLQNGECVLDPWNGSGTTTSAAVSLGLNAFGYDLNPVMVLVAKARCLDTAEFRSLRPLCSALKRKAERRFILAENDPLLEWLNPSAAAAVRSVESAIQNLLIDEVGYISLDKRGVDSLSDLAAFFYVALFRTLRQILRIFLGSNPTWVKRPASWRFRLRPSPSSIREAFSSHVNQMLPDPLPVSDSRITRRRIIGVASSECLPIATGSVDFVLASPPYCTRIDYAVATAPELALLGFGLDSNFDHLRRKLIGTATVPADPPAVRNDWGKTCAEFLTALSGHTSKASATYYYKNHLQYFRSIATSLSEIGRVLQPGGQCVLVVQDSYYKDVHNNLPLIFAEMGAFRDLQLVELRHFPLARTLAAINPGAKEYRDSFAAVESVLVMSKTKRFKNIATG